MLEKKILNISKIENTDKYDRKKVGYLSGMIGTFLNVTLGVSKFVIGILANSVSITADAVNNFSDAIYSFATVLGFKFSSAPPDRLSLIHIFSLLDIPENLNTIDALDVLVNKSIEYSGAKIKNKYKN